MTGEKDHMNICEAIMWLGLVQMLSAKLAGKGHKCEICFMFFVEMSFLKRPTLCSQNIGTFLRKNMKMNK